MGEIDLIPRDYRERVIIYGWGRRLSVIFTLFLALSIAVYVVLDVANRRLEKNVELLQNKQQSVAQARDLLNEVREHRDVSKHQWELLYKLRDSTAAAKMFEIIDRAILAGDIWFLNLEFIRSGAIREIPSGSSDTEYFIMLPDNKTGEAWVINTKMKIKGSASNHSSLSRFVRRLYEQPEVKDVRILNTSITDPARAVSYDLVVTLSSHLENG